MTNAPEVDALVDAARRRPEGGRVVAFPTPDAQLVKATMAMAETEQLKAQLEFVRAQLSEAQETLSSLSWAAIQAKRATGELEQKLALSVLLAKALAIGVEERPCPTCGLYRCESDCPERER